MIDKATAQRIKDTANIVEVVSDYVQLKRSGSNFVGLCPFHNERTPSFHVNKARNFCYCFSCHKGGSPVNFIMEKEGISYPEALRQLAAKYGIKIEEKELSNEEKEQQSEREAMMAANLWAMEYFENTLHNTEEGVAVGLSYLYEKRVITFEAVKAFHLGYCPDSGYAFVKAAKEKGLRMELLETLGLIGVSKKGNLYGKYSGRVIFPIQNSSGKVVGFGGRDLNGQNAKYINSPESDIYKKSFQLYGLFQAKNTIGKENECFLVEGYFDVIGMWQAGIKNVVASSGTSLTDGHINLIKRFTHNVTLIYDGDAPGIKASLKGIDKLLRNEMNVNVLLLPDGDDPDSFARKHNAEDLKEYLRSNKTDFIRFKIDVLLKDASNSPQKRFEVINSIIDTISVIPDRMKRFVYAQDSSRLLGVSEEEMVKEIDRRRYVMASSSQKEIYQEDMERPEVHKTESSPEASSSAKPMAISVNEFLKKQTAVYPLLPLEWKVLQYCIKYGFSTFCYEDYMEGEEHEQRAINVMEYVEEELNSDGTNFSVPEFSYIFSLIKKLYPDFKSNFDTYIQLLTETKKEKLDKGYADIADNYSSMREIERAEKSLEDELDQWETEQLDNFAKTYVANELSNHEEEIVRHFTNEAIFERHQLSHIYSKDRPAEREEDRLFSLLPNSLSVWKNGLLDLRIKQLFNRFREIGGKGNIEEEQSIQLELNSLMQTRSAIAKDIGDRILLPGRRATR
ncbi:MAG: DNA primase [Muribaculaceae bacterium]|nr:DNA primase [Muribaculaceae bacterium]